jgi:hypothetical protein
MQLLTPTQQQALKALGEQLGKATTAAQQANLPWHDVASVVAMVGLAWWHQSRTTPTPVAVK